MTLGTTIGAGFGIVTLVAVALGLTGYVMFGRVDINVAALGGHSSPAVMNVTGVERSAFECILDQKHYVIEKKDEHKAKQDADMASTKVAYMDAKKALVIVNDIKATALGMRAQAVKGMINELIALVGGHTDSESGPISQQSTCSGGGKRKQLKTAGTPADINLRAAQPVGAAAGKGRGGADEFLALDGHDGTNENLGSF